tara:strand:- start:321 stop:692 length:372 start_codon:yes stop_codon:yes gene_type:complete
MRQIEKQMNFALSNKGNFSNSNTSVSYHPSENLSEVRLHGNLIAWFDHTKQLLAISSAGWHTNTTKSRLNALLYEINTGVRVFQKNFDWYVSDFTGKRIVDFYDGLLVNKDGFSSLESHPNVA